MRRKSLAISLVLGLIVIAAVGSAYGGAPRGQVRAASAPSFTTPTRLGFPAGNDWEPALAADTAGHVYTLYKHYDVSGQVTCPSCDQHLLVQVSADNGRTWGAPVPIDPEATKGGQFDPQIAVDPVDGKTVWASYLQNNKSSIAVTHSSDFGQTWAPPTIVENLQRATDKDELAVRGPTIAVAFNAAQKIYASVSHDGGQTWNTSLINSGDTQLGWSLSGGGAIDVLGNLYFAWDGFTQNGGAKGPVNLFVTRSSDGGVTWTKHLVDVSGAPYPCDNCGFAFLSAQLTLRVGSDDSVYLIWNGTVDQTDYAPERVWFARSTDHGNTYTARQDVSLAAQGVEHSFPAVVVGSRAGDVRITWMDMRTGAWNVYYRASGNGGSTWGSEAQISVFVPGYPYLTSTGFGSPYGDYMSLAVDALGRTQAVWGEGPSYAGPGNMWTAYGS
jgi:BNR repeat-like domain